MKKRLLGAMVLLLCMALLPATAHAEEVRVSVTATPTELSDSGTVSFTFSISNFSDYELSDIVIAYGGNSYDALRETVIPPNQSVQDFNLDLPVQESQLGNPITFSITCVRNGEPITQETTITIARSSDPVITVTRTADAEMAKQGDRIKLTYKFANETKFDMRDIMLIDEDVSDEPIKLDVLRAGDSSSFDKQYTMGAESVISAPVVTYTVNGKAKSFSGIAPLTLESLLVQLGMNVDAGTPTAAGVNFTIEVKNTGNQEITGITITDERNNPVNNTPFLLKSGDSNTISFLVVPLMSEPLRNVKFMLKGTDSMGQPYTLESPKTYEVYPFVDDTQIAVTARAETVTPWSSDAGKLVARVIVTNHSTVTLTNVSVSETTIGVLKAYDTLPAGETSFDQEILLGSPRNLQFLVKGADPTGMTRELANCALPVAYGAEATQALQTPAIQTGEAELNALGFFSSTISRILVVLGVLMVIAFLVLIVLSAMERGRGSLFVRYDDEDEDDDYDDGYHGGDDLDRIFRKPIHGSGYHDDAEEVLSYTQRMQSQTRRNAAPTNAPRQHPTVREQALPAILLPPAGAQSEQPMVNMEYDEDAEALYAGDYEAEPSRRVRRTPYGRDAGYGAQEAYGQSASRARRQEPVYQNDARTHRLSDAAQMPNDSPDPAFDDTGVANRYAPDEWNPAAAPHTPKVIVNKRQASVQPQRRNTVRHVHPQDK